MSVDIGKMRSTPPGYFTVRWGLPEYTDWIDESLSWKEACYIGDWSFLWERRFRGPDALKLFSDISVNSFAKFDIGQSKHVIHTNKNGKVIHEGILSRLDSEEFLLFGRGCFWADYNLRHGKYNATSEPDDLFNLQVSGPNAIYLLEKVSGQSLRGVKFMHSGKIRIAGIEMLALRQGMAGEIGFELQGPIKFREQVTAAVMEAGEEFGIRKLGGRAVFVNHLEACFPTIITDYCPAMFDDDMAEYRAEFEAAMPGFAITFNIAGSFEGSQISDWYRSPVELGWSKNVKFDHDFIGRAALEPEVANPKRLMRTLSRRHRRGLCLAISRRAPLRFHGHAARPARVHVRRQGNQERQGRRRVDLARLQLLLPRNAISLHARRRVLRGGHRGRRRLGEPGWPAEGNPRHGRAGAVQNRQPQTRHS